MAMLGAKFDPNDPRYLQPNMGSAQIPASLPTAPATPQSGLDTSGLASIAAGMPQMAARKAGMNWLGILADALSGAAGQPGQFAARQERQHENDLQSALYDKHYAMQRADKAKDDQTELAQQLQLLDYKRLHPDDELNRQMDEAGITDPALRASYALKALTKSTTDDPYITTSLPGDRIYSGPRSGLAAALGGGGGTATPPKAHELTPVQGGAGGNVSGNFPR